MRCSTSGAKAACRRTARGLQRESGCLYTGPGGDIETLKTDDGPVARPAHDQPGRRPALDADDAVNDPRIDRKLAPRRRCNRRTVLAAGWAEDQGRDARQQDGAQRPAMRAPVYLCCPFGANSCKALTASTDRASLPEKRVAASPIESVRPTYAHPSTLTVSVQNTSTQ